MHDVGGVSSSSEGESRRRDAEVETTGQDEHQEKRKRGQTAFRPLNNYVTWPAFSKGDMDNPGLGRWLLSQIADKM